MSDGCGDFILLLLSVAGQKRKLRLRVLPGVGPAVSLFQNLPCAGERVALGMHQVLDLQGQFHIAAAVKPLAGAALVGFELRKLRLPKTQDVGFQPADTRHIANLEVEAIGDRGRVEGALLGKLHGHGYVEEDTATEVQPCSKRSIGHDLHSL